MFWNALIQKSLFTSKTYLFMIIAQRRNKILFFEYCFFADLYLNFLLFFIFDLFVDGWCLYCFLLEGRRVVNRMWLLTRWIFYGFIHIICYVLNFILRVLLLFTLSVFNLLLLAVCYVNGLRSEATLFQRI